MAILAYDDVMLREPRLLVPKMQPVGLVTPNPVYGPWGALFVPSSKTRLVNLANGGRAGTIQGSPTIGVTRFGEALICNGTNGGIINHPLASSFPITGPITLFCYYIVKTFTPPAYGQYICEVLAGSGGYRRLQFYSGDSGVGRIYLLADGDTDSNPYSDPRVDTIASWATPVFSIMSVSNGVINYGIYGFGGNLTKEGTGSVSGAYTMTHFGIGGSGFGGANYYNGSADILLAGVFGKALSFTQIRQLAENPYLVCGPA